MKKIVLLSFCFATAFANAQNVKLDAGKKITTVSNFSMDMDMGMAGQMKSSGSTTNVLSITGMDDKNYTATTTVVKLKSTSDGMGKNISYDSDNKEDQTSDAGKELGKEIGKVKTISIDKTSGKATETNKPAIAADATDENPMKDLMSSMNSASAEGSAQQAIFVIPANKKAGDKWSDSSSINGIKTNNVYELISILNNMANISQKGTVLASISKEIQGMQMDININTTATSTLMIDSKTSLVKKRTLTGSMDGTLEVAGQSLPITAKMTSESTFD